MLVGGAFAAWHEIRDATSDVDTIGTIDETLHVAAEVVAARRDLGLQQAALHQEVHQGWRVCGTMTVIKIS